MSTPTPDDFWQRCLKAGCVIVPVNLFSGYSDDGNIDPSLAIGPGYIPLPVDNDVICNTEEDELYFMIEEGAGNPKDVFQTPEDALKAFEDGNPPDLTRPVLYL